MFFFVGGATAKVAEQSGGDEGKSQSDEGQIAHLPFAHFVFLTDDLTLLLSVSFAFLFASVQEKLRKEDCLRSHPRAVLPRALLRQPLPPLSLKRLQPRPPPSPELRGKNARRDSRAANESQTMH